MDEMELRKKYQGIIWGIDTYDLYIAIASIKSWYKYFNYSVVVKRFYTNYPAISSAKYINGKLVGLDSK